MASRLNLHALAVCDNGRVVEVVEEQRHVGTLFSAQCIASALQVAVIFIDCYFNSSCCLGFLNSFSVIHTSESSSSGILRLAVISEVSASTPSDFNEIATPLPSVSPGDREVVNLVSLDCKDVVVNASVEAFLLTT